MSRSNQPKRPSEYRMPVFMNEVPEEAEQEAEEMALRHGVNEPRQATKAKPRQATKAKPRPPSQQTQDADGVEHHGTEQALGGGEAGASPESATGPETVPEA